MDKIRLEQQMKFLIEIDKLKSIFRQNYLTDGIHRENDAEHSWHLAMMVMVLSEHFEHLDVLKTLKMVLIHDIVEIYAGDTFAYDEVGYEDKEERENAAADKIFSILPSNQTLELKDLWIEFEGMETNESICAAAVDRIQPLTLNVSSIGKMWKEKGITVEKVLKRNELVLNKAPKIIADYVRELILDADNKGYFFKSI